ncbi:MAG TPA: ATP-binding protein [Patescibacteria group bacterium]|nr:ATP-binding protein [Patescibacteria group bacterium]
MTIQPHVLDTLMKLMPTLVMYIVLFGISILVGVAGVYITLHLIRARGREKVSLQSALLQVAVPRDNEIKIDVAEQVFASLYSIKKGGFFSFLKAQSHISFEIVGRPEDIRFYINTPRSLRDLVEKQIHAAYPGAYITEVEEYNIFNKEGKVAFAEFKLKEPSYYPIKTYKDLPTDPLSSLTTAMSKLQPGEGACLQIIISPAESKWRSSGRGYVSKVRQEEATSEKPKFKADPKVLEAIDTKCGKPGFDTTIRVVVSSSTVDMAKSHLANIKSAFQQFSNPIANTFSGKRIWLKWTFVRDFIYRYPPFLGTPMVLTSDELASIFHFPNKFVETPHIYWLNAKRAPAPAQISLTGLYLGKSIFRGVSRPVSIQENDRRKHLYIIGKTGTGKSELMKDMALQDIKEGRGVCFIDPHDTVEKLLQLIPPERAEDVIYFDPADTERPMALNMLEAYTEDQKHFVATYVINMMYKLFDPHKTGIVGPRFEHAIRNAMLTVMSEPGSTFVEVVRALTDAEFVAELLPKVQDPIVRRYWTDQIAQTSDFHKSETLDYIVSKFGRFVTNKLMRNIIGQSKSAFDIRKVMDEGKILLINLAKGRIGEENSNFLGLILVPRILMAAMSRQDVPEEERRDFYLYVDEFQNFATADFAQILSEARKYRLNLTVANQFIGQVEEEIKNAVFGNVGTVISFRVGVSDANFLQHEFQPTFTESDLINIDRFNAYVKTVVNGEPVVPFSIDLTKDLSLERPNLKVAEAIKQLSRLRYGADREIVEEDIINRAHL